MKIRKATLKDLEEIDKIYVEGAKDETRLQFSKKEAEKIIKTFDKHKKDRLKGFNKGLVNKDNYWIVVEGDKKIIGFGEAEIENKKGRIENVYIHKKYRKEGLGTKITKELIKWLKKRKIEDITSAAYIKNKPSIKMHEKLGFKPIVVRMELK